MALAQRYVPASTEADGAEDEISQIFKKFYDRRGPREAFKKEWSQMSTQEKNNIRQAAEQLHDRMIGNMRSMPPQLMLVFR
jgi:hypothetical protein